MKEKYSRFRELWAVPKYKVLFKLCGWILFFMMIFFVLALTENNSQPPRESNNNQNTENITINQKKENLLEANLRINYYITAEETFFIEGTLIDNIIEGTLENEEIMRIRITEENVYIINRDEEIVTDVLNELNLALLFPINIIEILLNNEALNYTIEGNYRSFFYMIDDLSITIHTNEEEIYKIIILDGNITYEFEYSAI